MRNKVTCPACQGFTSVNYQTERVRGDIKHTYAQCENCDHKVTVHYTNSQIRKLLKRQQSTVGMEKKRKLADKIQQLISELNDEIRSS